MPTITEEQWNAKGVELFGENRDSWAFICPSCGHVMSIERARAQYAQHLSALRAADFRLEQECIGRAVPGLGCNWCAYGLFRGPVLVKRPDGKEIPIFDFVGKPFTADVAQDREQ